MSLVECLFPASELAAMKHAVLTAADGEPAAKRRKVSRQQSFQSRYSTDSGYNSDESSHARRKSAVPVLSHSNSTSSTDNEAVSPTSSNSDEEDFCTKIAEARARLYSNASLSIPSPPSLSEAIPSPISNSTSEDYRSPVSVESLASARRTSGCNLGTFISLGLATTSHERSLLNALAPEPKALPVYTNAELQAKKLQWLQRRKAAFVRQQALIEQQRRKTSYQGFAISTHDDEEEQEVHRESGPEKEQQQEQRQELNAQLAGATPAKARSSAVEQMFDFFNIEAASEEELENAR